MAWKLKALLSSSPLHRAGLAALTLVTLGVSVWAGSLIWQRPCRETATNWISSSPECPPLFLDLVPLVVALGFWGAGVAMWLMGSQSLTVAFFLLGSSALGAGKLSALGNNVGKQMFYPTLAWLGPVILRFHIRLLEKTPSRLERGMLRFADLLAIGLSLPFLFYAPASLEQQHWFTFLRPSIRLIFALSVTWMNLLLFRGCRGHVSPVVRRRVRILLFGAVLALTPLLLLSLLPDTLGLLHVPYEWTFPSLLIIPLTYVYVLLHHRFIKAESMLNRVAVYYLLAILMLSIYLAAFAALTRLTVEVIRWQVIGISILLSTGLLILIAPLRVGIERLTHWVWFGAEASYVSLIERLAESLALALDSETLGRLLVDELASVMRLSKGALFLRDQDDSLAMVRTSGFEFSGGGHLQLPMSDSLVTYLKTTTEPIVGDVVRCAMADTALKAAEQVLLSRTDVALWLPLISTGTLQGLLLIGYKVNGESFTAEDEHILATLAHQSGIAAHNVQLIEQVQTGRKELARAHQQLLVGQEQEQRRLAHDLHDSVVQQLIGISYQLAESRQKASNAQRANARNDGELSAVLESIRQGLLEVVTQLRGLISELRPAGLEELGLTTALEGYVARLRREGESDMPRIQLDLDESGVELPDPIAICLFRVAQEALRNILRHARAQNVFLEFDLLDGEALLTIRDDGHGFHVPARLSKLTQTNHFGLVGMAERVNWAGGQLAIRSQPGKGTEITVQIPLNGGKPYHG